MALIDSVGGLYSAVNTKAGALTSVAKGILCIPAILTGLPGILGNVAKGVLGSLQNQALGAMSAIVSGITGLITDTVTNAVNEITGAISNVLDKVLQLQATILATIGLAQSLINSFKSQITDALDFAKNQENCRFAAAEMLKCVTGSIIGDISKKVAVNAKLDISGIDKLVGDVSSKISKPGNIIEQYTGKLSSSVDKATSQINTSKLL
jgi:phage-related protein